MSDLQAFILGLIQGLTEYLPVSSSGHLAIASNWFGLENGEQNLTFTVALHVATVLSTIVILWSDIVWIFKGLFRWDGELNKEQKYVLYILVSMIPVGIVGLLFKDEVEYFFGTGLFLVGTCLVITALLLIFSYYANKQHEHHHHGRSIKLHDAFIIGLAQAAAVLPGLSRSGSTIATGMLLGKRKDKLAQFSFLMVIPPILGEALLDIIKGVTHGTEAATAGISASALLIGFFTAFLSGCLACKWMLHLVRKGKLVYFGIYCAVVGLLLMLSSVE